MRINIEDKLFSDYRFKALVRVIGDEWRAVGMLVDFWRAAAKHWSEDGALMPFEQFCIQGFEPIAKVGLADIRSDGVYARGLIDHIDWARKKREAAQAAGEASAAARKLKYGTAQPIKAKADQPVVSHNSRTTSERPFEDFRTPFEKTPNEPNAPAPVHAPTPEPHHESANENHHSYKDARARVIEFRRNDDENDVFDWEVIDQGPLAQLGIDPIDPAGLRKLRKVGFTSAEITSAIRSFIDDFDPRKYRNQRIGNPTGLLMAHLLGMPRKNGGRAQ